MKDSMSIWEADIADIETLCQMIGVKWIADPWYRALNQFINGWVNVKDFQELLTCVGMFPDASEELDPDHFETCGNCRNLTARLEWVFK